MIFLCAASAVMFNEHVWLTEVIYEGFNVSNYFLEFAELGGAELKQPTLK